ncbi:MAG: hypothetical protein IGS39_00440 [Calothrix sp. C42_A2020_038]|nr:hypothetical protein [Calothrix sp. C42_A2020_038]
MSNDLTSLLLQALSASSSKGRLPVKELLLSQLDADPNTAMLIDYLIQQPTAEPEEESSFDEDTDLDLLERRQKIASAQVHSQEMAKAVNQLRQKVNDMYAELEELRARNDMLAAALGACYLCWGDNSTCEMCEGKGYPGFFSPDKQLFRQFVMPVVYRHKQESFTRREEKIPNNLNSRRVNPYQ